MCKTAAHPSSGADPENFKGGPGKIVDNLSRESANFTPFFKKFYKMAAKGGGHDPPFAPLSVSALATWIVEELAWALLHVYKN